MLPNGHRIYRIIEGRVVPDCLSGEEAIATLLREWHGTLLKFLGASRSSCEQILQKSSMITKGDRWQGRRKAALIKVFLDGMGWTTQRGELDLDRLITEVNSKILFPCESVDECFLQPKDILKEIAVKFGYCSVKELEKAARNTSHCKVLTHADENSAATSIQRYDLAQLQTALYNCQAAEVEMRADFKHFVRTARLSGFDLTVTNIADGYRFTIGATSHFSGPKGYGCALSKLADTLVNLSDWKLTAEFHDHAFHGKLQVASTDGYVSPKPKAKMFDTAVEEKFWLRWHEQDRLGWNLFREPRLHSVGKTIFCPDFEAEKEGKRVTLEIVGKNDPAYFVPKLESLPKLLPPRSVLLVKKQMADYFSGLPAVIVPYANNPDPLDVVAALDQAAGFGP